MNAGSCRGWRSAHHAGAARAQWTGDPDVSCGAAAGRARRRSRAPGLPRLCVPNAPQRPPRRAPPRAAQALRGWRSAPSPAAAPSSTGSRSTSPRGKRRAASSRSCRQHHSRSCARVACDSPACIRKPHPYMRPYRTPKPQHVLVPRPLGHEQGGRPAGRAHRARATDARGHAARRKRDVPFRLVGDVCVCACARVCACALVCVWGGACGGVCARARARVRVHLRALVCADCMYVLGPWGARCTRRPA